MDSVSRLPQTPAISIIVTSYTSERLGDIQDLLLSIKNQVARNFEVIYVVERDNTLEGSIARIGRRLDLALRVLSNKGEWGLAEARNLGARGSVGEIIAFVDDDVMLRPDWSQSVERVFQEYPGIHGITGPAYPFWVGTPLEWWPVELDWLIGCTRWFHANEIVKIRNCWGMNMAFQRRKFEGVGGFSRETGYHRGVLAEDVELSLKLGGGNGEKLLYVPDMAVFSKVHPYRLQTRFVIERSMWIGYSRRTINRGYSTLDGLSPEYLLVAALAKRLLNGSIFRRMKRVSDLLSLSRLVFVIFFSALMGYLICS